jgi:hypothetical protein
VAEIAKLREAVEAGTARLIELTQAVSERDARIAELERLLSDRTRTAPASARRLRSRSASRPTSPPARGASPARATAATATVRFPSAQSTGRSRCRLPACCPDCGGEVELES